MDKKVKNKKLILYTMLEVTVLIVMTAVGNMWDWVNMEFHPESIATSGFWEDTIIKATLYSGSLVLAILLKLQKLELKDTRYDDLLGQYRGKLVLKNDNKTAFSKYIDKTLNPQIKIEYLQTKYNTKLYRIQKHERDSWIADYFKAKELDDPFKYKFSGWFNGYFSKRYFTKRTRIEAVLADGFIESNYPYLRCKCPRISATQFGYYLEVSKNKDAHYKLDNEVVKDVAGQAILKIISVFFISICLTIMALNPATNELLEQANGWVVLLIKYIVRVIMVCLSFATGIWTANSTFNDNYLLPLINRISILDSFALWLDVNPVQEVGVESIKKQLEEELRKEYDEKLENAKRDAIAVVEKFNKEQTKEVA